MAVQLAGEHPAAWHIRRLETIGASEAAAVAGLSRWSSPIQVWERKVERIIPDEGTTRLRLRMGNLVEPILATIYAEETGRHVDRRNRWRTSKAWPWAHAEIDGISYPVDAAGVIPADRRLLELKTADMIRGFGDPEDGAEALPMEYRLQVQHALAVTGLERADVYVVIGYGRQTLLYTLEREPRTIAALAKVEADFMERVRLRIPPEIDGTDAYREYLARRYPIADEPIVRPATPEEELLVAAVEVAVAETKRAEVAEAKAKNLVRAAIGTDAGIAGASGRATWTYNADPYPTDWKLVAAGQRHAIGEFFAGRAPSAWLADDALDALESVYTDRKPGARVLRLNFGRKAR
jgi:putative phage-type endonuclease